MICQGGVSSASHGTDKETQALGATCFQLLSKEMEIVSIAYVERILPGCDNVSIDFIQRDKILGMESGRGGTRAARQRWRGTRDQVTGKAYGEWLF